MTFLKVQDFDSALYRGNITFRVDPTWGVAGSSQKQRARSNRLSRSARKSPGSSYERCKDTQRCSRGWNYYNSSDATSSFTMQRFAGGQHESIPLFADFEDWRQGTHGWTGICDMAGCGTRHAEFNPFKPKGAHWSPFQFPSLGPSIPSYNNTVNSGLVLNYNRKLRDLAKQEEWIKEIQDYRRWIELESNITSLDAGTRSRVDIIATLNETYQDYERLLAKEEEKLLVLSKSQCTNQPCHLLFNTSSLAMTGAINAMGSIGITPDGTEVAVWTFESIDLGPEVEVVLTGQRAMSLLSKSSVYIDTEFVVRSGTLGGFPGGYSIFRKKEHRMVSVCDEETIGLFQTWKCMGDKPLSNRGTIHDSNNVNGPGSPSVRFHSFT